MKNQVNQPSVSLCLPSGDDVVEADVVGRVKSERQQWSAETRTSSRMPRSVKKRPGSAATRSRAAATETTTAGQQRSGTRPTLPSLSEVFPRTGKLRPATATTANAPRLF